MIIFNPKRDSCIGYKKNLLGKKVSVIRNTYSSSNVFSLSLRIFICKGRENVKWEENLSPR